MPTEKYVIWVGEASGLTASTEVYLTRILKCHAERHALNVGNESEKFELKWGTEPGLSSLHCKKIILAKYSLRGLAVFIGRELFDLNRSAVVKTHSFNGIVDDSLKCSAVTRAHRSASSDSV